VTEAALTFLEWLRPGGPWVLTAIAPERAGAMTRTCLGPAEVVEFLAAHAGASNVYYSLNPTTGPVSRKPSRADVRSMEFLHVDVDPRKDADQAEERARILGLLSDRLPPGVPRPSAVVDSGGGYQALWRLSDPVEINGEEAAYEAAKRYNVQLELVFGADHCHNVDRILRLPGTTNFPDARKRARGRKQAPSTAEWLEDATYPLRAFTPAPDVQRAAPTGFSASKARVSGNVRRLQSLDELPSSVSPLCKIVISHGFDPSNPGRWPSRSEPLFWVCCELARQGVDDETIFSIITDREWKISDSVLERGAGAEKYALHQIDRAKEETIAPELRTLNEQFAVVLSGGKCRVIMETEDAIDEDHMRSRIEYVSFADFANFYSNRRIEVTAERGQVVSTPLGKWWLHHPARREYRDVVFSPGKEVPGCYNLWKGFAFEARSAIERCQMFLDHMREVVCSGNEDHYDYLVRWMATAVQRPGDPGHVAVVLRGRQGTGKNKFADTFGALFGRHYLMVRDSNHLFGTFNAHMRDCCVLFANEAFWAGNKKHEAMLKSLVTEATIMSEGKGENAMVARNCVKLIMASNEDWVVPANHDDRRFFVLDVAPTRRQDTTHFARMTAQMRDGGYEALLHHLLSMDLTGFDVRRAPQTCGLQDQKVLSFAPEQAWWYEKLMAGRTFEDRDGWLEQVAVTDLTCDYVTSCSRFGTHNRGSSIALARFLDKATGGSVRKVQWSGTRMVRQVDGTTREVVRARAYCLPDLARARAVWDASFGGPYSWPEPEKLVEMPEGAIHF
jgi:hypothetical protein